MKSFALGIVLIFIGLLFILVSQTPVTTNKEDRQLVKVGERDSTEISDVPLNSGDKFTVFYSGGRPAIPEEVDMIVYDPLGSNTTVSYMNMMNGLIANHTGAYKIQLSGVFIDPSRPLILTVQKIIEYTVTDYPNSNLLPVGLSMIAVGAGISLWGARSSRRRVIRRKKKRHAR